MRTMTRRHSVAGLACGLLAAAVVALAPFSTGAQSRPAAKPGRMPDTFRPLKILMLGQDQRHHNSHALYAAIAPPLARQGIQITHVDTPDEALAAETLADYDALVLYANHTK